MYVSSGNYPPRTNATGDDRPAVLLLAALVELARKDANRGDKKAAAWLADLAAHRPRGAVRILDAEAPPQVELLAEVEAPHADPDPAPSPVGRAVRLAMAATPYGWPGRLPPGAARKIGEVLDMSPGSVRNALAGLRRAVGVSAGATGD